MSGSGKAGNGRGNNRRRSFKHTPQESEFYLKGNGVTPKNNNPPDNDTSRRNRAFHKKNHNRLQNSENQNHQNRATAVKKNGEPWTEKVSLAERPKWVPPEMNTEPLPVPDCPWCGKPIRDISSAIADKDTGVPVHFDCVAAKIAGGENLENGDMISYIGGGRFGIVCFGSSTQASGTPAGAAGRGSPSEFRDFKIKKIIEWENKEKRAEWRSLISDHYSVI